MYDDFCIEVSSEAASLSSSVQMNEQTMEKYEKIESSSISSNDLLTTIYDITRAIFRHLPIRSIDSCSLVCQSWVHLARLTKAHRHTIHTLTYPSNPLSQTINPSYLLSDFDTFISSYINNTLWSIPYLAFVVVTNSLEKKGFDSSSTSLSPPSKSSKRLRSQTTARRTEGLNISQALLRHLNKSCQVLMVASDGIIASNDENQSNEIESDDAMGILFLPKFPSNVLGVYPFEIPRNAQIPADMSRSDLHHFLGHVPDDIPIRCVIFFFIQRRSHTIDCIKKLLEYYSSDVVIIGGFVNKIDYNNRENQQKKSSLSNACGIVLTGDTNHLNIRQIVLESQKNTREDIQNKLKELKSIENQSCLSFAIQVSCVARGSEFYNDEQNVECSEFRNLFPNTPLIGIFGNGEIGHDYLPNNNQTTQGITEDLFLSYSTVFSLISLHIK